VTEIDLEYLHTRTRYLTRDQLLAAGRRWFAEVTLLEELALKHGRRARRAYPFARIFPPLARLYGELGVRLLLLRRASDEARDRGYERAAVIDATPGVEPRPVRA
jgi:hypothetical protein